MVLIPLYEKQASINNENCLFENVTNSVVANKDIADKFEIGIKQINVFRRIAQHCTKGLERYEDDVDAFQIHVVSNIQKLKQIHDEINTGEKCGIKKMTDMVRNHLNSLEIK